MPRLLALFLLASLALANPRVGLHQGFTRMVLDLPQGSHYRLVDREGRLVLELEAALPPAQVRVDSPELLGYRVAGKTVELRLRPGVEVRTFVLEGTTPGTYRLVLDFKKAAAPKARKPDPPRPVVVLDPGHGGPDPGATHVFPGLGLLMEKTITLDVALRVKRILEAKGVRVVLTRATDTDLAPPDEPDLWKRKLADLKKRARMADPKKTLFVSIHVNSAPRPARGVETYYLGRAADPEALRLAVWENGGGEVGRRLTRETETLTDKVLKDLLAQANLSFSEQLAGKIEARLSQAAASPDRGVHSAPLYVLRYARIPAVLVEVGFLNHPQEGRALATPAHRQAVAEGIAEGILQFLSSGAYAFK